MKESKLNHIVKKAGETVRRASAVTIDAIKVAHRQFTGLPSHESLQIPETTMEAHILAKISTRGFIQEQKIVLEKQLSSRNANRSESLVARHQRNLTRNDNNHRNNHRNNQNDKKVELKEIGEIPKLFGEFVVDLNEQRRLLKPSARERYDSLWGVDPTGEFSRQWSATKSSIGLLSAEDSLRNEMKYVKKETKHKVDKLKLATDSQIGLEILHMFVLDILGRDTPAAKIFLTKSQIE